jgi:hypothetical protein
VNLAKIEINDFGGAPIAEHNMPCAVCGTNHAVLEIGFGRFSPCWECQKKGWELIRKPTGPWYKRWYKRIEP